MEKNNEINSATSEVKNKVVRTYAETMAEVIENDKEGGLVKKIVHGEEESEALKRNLSPESKKNKFFMFTSVVLVSLAFVTLSFFLFRTSINTVPIENLFVPIIFNDKTAFIEVAGFNRDEILQTILNKVNSTEVKVGGVEGIYLSHNKKVVGLRQFISLIKGNLVPNDNTPEGIFVKDNFLMGVVNGNTKPASPAGRDFFMILKVHSVSDVFNSFREWEHKILSDLHGAFGVDISLETNYLFTKNFEDGIIENKNARILYDKDAKIVLMYIFADDNSVIITNTQNAAREVITRLAGSRVKK